MQGGNLGAAVIPVLTGAGFSVSLLSRSEKKGQDLPPGVKSVVVDYGSEESLKAAFRGKDVVIAALGMEAVGSQPAIIDAAISAGVKRFIPSDFGSVSTDPQIAGLGPYPLFVGIQNYLKEKAAQGVLEYTIFSTGGFTEFLVGDGILVDLKGHSVELWEDGQHRISSTTMAGIGKAIVGALKQPEASKNRNLLVHEFVITQAQILDLHRKHDPAGTEWTVTSIDDPRAELTQREKVLAAEPNGANALAFIKATIMGGLFRAHYEKVDNELVGLELRPEADLEAILVQARNRPSPA